MKVVRVNSENQDFITLVKELDAYLKITDGDEHNFYHQFNNIDVLKAVVVAYEGNTAVGCGAIKKFDEEAVEVKRMYVLPEKRGKGIAQQILAELEIWAATLGYKKCVLETGKRQVEAVHLYKKCNYTIVENYEQYKGMKNSICFEKEL